MTTSTNEWAQEYIQYLVENEMWEELQLIHNTIQHHEEYHRISRFTPYPFQTQFYRKGKDYRYRFLMAGNRVGKSFSMAQEVSYHLTGLYPEWWEGKRFDHPPLVWAIGITSDTTRKVLQKELLGTIMAKNEAEMGTGSIPRDYIDFTNIEKDGNIVRVIKIQHHSEGGKKDGWSTLEFRTTSQGEHTLMGPSVDFIWLDEQDPYNDTKIFAQCVTRTMTTRGLVAITATPEAGRTNLVDDFLTNGFGKSETKYCQNTTWDEAEHLTPEIQEEILDAIPVWQREMRKSGLPVIGQGVIFSIGDDEILCDPFPIPLHWKVLWALDVGTTNDPTVVTQAVHDPDGDVYYIVSQLVLDEDRSAKASAEYIMGTDIALAPVIPPHDAADGKDGSAGYGTLMKHYGCNVQPSFYNPHDITTNMVGVSNKNPRAIAPGLHWMNDHFKSGKLKVFKGCESFIKEKHSYHVNDKGSFKGSDHSIDSARYAFMSLKANRGVPYGQCLTGNNRSDFNNGFDEAFSIYGGSYYDEH